MNQSQVDQTEVDQSVVDQIVVNNNLLKFILENKIYQPTEMEQLFTFFICNNII